MSSVFDKRVVLIIATGTGLGALISSAITYLVVKRTLTETLLQLVERVSQLTQQVDRLRRLLEEKQARKPGFLFSSTEEEDDVYEDAYGGLVFEFLLYF